MPFNTTCNLLKSKFSNPKKFIKHLRRGDTNAYAFLAELYYDKLCDYATNLARDNFKSEDIVQNVIVRMWQQRENLNPNVSIKNYLYRSVYNEFIDQYRKDMAISALEKKYIESIDLISETDDEGENKRLIALIEQEIDLLPNKCKETFLLSKKEGLTYNEIAEYQDVSVNTVEKQMVKAFSILREKIKEKMLSFLFFVFCKKKKV